MIFQVAYKNSKFQILNRKRRSKINSFVFTFLFVSISSALCEHRYHLSLFYIALPKRKMDPESLEGMDPKVVLAADHPKINAKSPFSSLQSNAQVRGAVANLANSYYAQGKYEKAEPLFKSCIDADKKNLGETHPEILSLMNGLANTYYKLNRFDEAEVLLVDVLAKRTEVLGDEHPDTLNSMNNLASLYLTKKKYADAERIYKECIAVQTRLLGSNHPDTLNSNNNLASLYYKQKKYDLAEPLFENCLRIHRAVLGTNIFLFPNCFLYLMLNSLFTLINLLFLIVPMCHFYRQ